MNPLRQIIIFCIGLVSGFFKSVNVRACRFHPSCSKYSAEAFRTLSLPGAFYLMVKRLLSCHPFSEGGYDPIPEPHGVKRKD